MVAAMSDSEVRTGMSASERGSACTERAWRSVLLRVVVMGVLALGLAQLHLRNRPETLCPMRMLTGVPCPLCGGTTAAIALGKGDMVQALRASPLAVVGAALFVLVQTYLQALMGTVSESLAAVPILSALTHPDRWLLWLGILFVASVYAFPGGIVGRLRSGAPEWRPAGARGLDEALRRCRDDWSFGGGPGVLGQWVEDGRDRNVVCPGAMPDPGQWFHRY